MDWGSAFVGAVLAGMAVAAFVGARNGIRGFVREIENKIAWEANLRDKLLGDVDITLCHQLDMIKGLDERVRKLSAEVGMLNKVVRPKEES